MIAAVFLVHWLLFKTKTGFEFRASGENPDAARYAGMRASLIIVIAMGTAGALAGLAGANQVLGVLERATPGFSYGIGFDAISVALLGRSHPVGVLFAGLLFGALEGRWPPACQVDAGVSIDLIGIIQALIYCLHCRAAARARDLPLGLPEVPEGTQGVTGHDRSIHDGRPDHQEDGHAQGASGAWSTVSFCSRSRFLFAAVFGYEAAGDATFRLSRPTDPWALPNLVIPAAPFNYLAAAVLAFLRRAPVPARRHEMVDPVDRTRAWPLSSRPSSSGRRQANPFRLTGMLQATMVRAVTDRPWRPCRCAVGARRRRQHRHRGHAAGRCLHRRADGLADRRAGAVLVGRRRGRRAVRLHPCRPRRHLSHGPDHRRCGDQSLRARRHVLCVESGFLRISRPQQCRCLPARGRSRC